MRTAKISASADMLDHRSVQPPNLLKKRFETPKPCRAEVLPEREASRKAALPYWSRMRRISLATWSRASSHEMRSYWPEPRGPVRRIGYFRRSL